MYNIFKYSIGLTYSTFKLLDQIFSVSMRLPAFCKICDYLKCQWSKSLIYFIMIGPTRLRLRANSELIAAVRQTSCLVRKVNKYWEWCEAVVGTITGVISRVHPGLWWDPNTHYSVDHDVCPVWPGTTYLYRRTNCG